jgi:ATP-dependent DNA ligase
VQIFDILRLNESDLTQVPLKYRKKILKQKLNIFYSERTHEPEEEDTEEKKEIIIDDLEALFCINGGFYKRFKNVPLDEAVDRIKEMQKYASDINCEGLVLKLSSSFYETKGTRSGRWLKLKNISIAGGEQGLQDTLDLVPIGAYYGKGKRAGQYGAYLLAAYNQ